MAKRKKLREERLPIIEHHNGITVTDTGIFQSSSFAAANWLEELNQLFLDRRAGGSLEGKRERLRAIIAGDSTAEQHRQIIVVIPRKGIAKGESFPVIKTVGFAGQRTHCEMARAEAAKSNGTQRERAITALKLLDHFLSEKPTNNEIKAFRRGCSFAEWMMGAELTSIERYALAGKRQLESAFNATVQKRRKASASHKEIRKAVKRILDADPGLNITGARRRYRKEAGDDRPCWRKVVTATKNL